MKPYEFDIGNVYGNLAIRKLPNGKCQWSVGGYDGHCWETIPQFVFDCLLKFWEGEME